jgi:hypothetical protein
MGRGLFQKKDKKIKFSKEMVNCISGFSSGSIPFVFESADLLVKEEVKGLSKKYLVNGQISMKKLVKALLEDKSEVGFMRSFILFMIATILCPRTYDSLSSKYLYSLRFCKLFKFGLWISLHQSLGNRNFDLER